MSLKAIRQRRQHHPSKHDILNQCWANFGPTSKKAGEHSPSIGSMYRVCWDDAVFSVDTLFFLTHISMMGVLSVDSIIKTDTFVCLRNVMKTDKRRYCM